MATFEQSLAELIAAVVEECPIAGLQFYGVATNVVDIEQFYIVPLRCYLLMHILENPGKIAENFSQYSIVIYLSPTLGRHVRGTVLRIAPNRACIMNAMDYGITDRWISPSNIFDLLHPEAGHVPALAHLCQLSMCCPRDGKNFAQDAKEAFRFFIGQDQERLTITIKENNSYKLEVLVISCQSYPDDISSAMASSYFTTFYPACV